MSYSWDIHLIVLNDKGTFDSADLNKFGPIDKKLTKHHEQKEAFLKVKHILQEPLCLDNVKGIFIQ